MRDRGICGRGAVLARAVNVCSRETSAMMMRRWLSFPARTAHRCLTCGTTMPCMCSSHDSSRPRVTAGAHSALASRSRYWRGCPHVRWRVVRGRALRGGEADSEATGKPRMLTLDFLSPPGAARGPSVRADPSQIGRGGGRGGHPSMTAESGALYNGLGRTKRRLRCLPAEPFHATNGQGTMR